MPSFSGQPFGRLPFYRIAGGWASLAGGLIPDGMWSWDWSRPPQFTPSPCHRFPPSRDGCPCEPFHAAPPAPLTGSPGCAAPADFPRKSYGPIIDWRFTGGKQRLQARSPLQGSAQGRPLGGVGFCRQGRRAAISLGTSQRGRRQLCVVVFEAALEQAVSQSSGTSWKLHQSKVRHRRVLLVTPDRQTLSVLPELLQRRFRVAYNTSWSVDSPAR